MIRHSAGECSVTAYLEGRIDTTNAEQIDTELATIIGASDAKNVTLDVDALTYVSSAGLRIFVKLHKSCEALSIVNASPRVYDVLQMTGLTQMLDVSRRPIEISLDGLAQIGAGAFGRVYRMDAERVVKVYDSSIGSLLAIERERRGAREAFTHGIPSAIPFQTVHVGGEYGVIYELIDARTIGEVVTAHPSQARAWGQRMADLALRLHNTHFGKGALPDARRIFHGWVDRAEKSGLYAPATIEELRRFVEAIPARDTFVHGDFHPANIMVASDDELTLIDMSDASMGDPVIDLAGAFHVVRIASRRPGGAMRLTGMPSELLEALWDSFLRTYFKLAEDADTAEVERHLRLYAFPRTMGSIARSKLIDDETRKRQAREAELTFLRMHDALEQT